MEIKSNNLNLFTIDSFFQKEFRLQTMTHWDQSLFQEKLGNKIYYGIVCGKPNSGKTTIAKFVAEKYKYQIIDMK